MFFFQVLALAALAGSAVSCDDCYGPTDFVVHERNVRRMQPTASNASYGPYRPLDWGQINFLHTTDTHGWLEGHIKEQNYGADWGDFVSFTRHMRNRAQQLNVDLLLIDTGDLHDGNGLSDATPVDGQVSNPVFENIDYDLLTIGNHELYISAIAYDTFKNLSRVYGDKYLTSNVQIYNPQTALFEYIGAKYRYFTTPHGLRIMAFGVLFDFTGNSNVSIVTKTADLVKQQWFINAVNYTLPIDLFVVIGHNPVRTTAGTSTFGTLYSTIRSIRPTIPIQAFGGHTHIRDFTVYDSMSTGLESGRYCETLGFLSMTGINSPTFFGAMNPVGVPNPTTIAVKPVTSSSSSASSSKASSSSTTSTGISSGKVSPTGVMNPLRARASTPVGQISDGQLQVSMASATMSTQASLRVGTTSTGVSTSVKAATSSTGMSMSTKAAMSSTGTSTSTKIVSSSTAVANPYRYSRRYLDWNRLTFAYHANASQSNPFDVDRGITVTQQITADRTALNLTALYGCAPATYCQTCQPFGAPGNIFSLLTTALAATVINQTRKDIPRLIIINTGSIRFDLVEGPFTYDDSFIVSPFTDAFQFIPNVPYKYASQVLGILNAGPNQKRDLHTHNLESRDFGFAPVTGECLDPHLGPVSPAMKRSTRGIVRRQSTTLVPGYVTTDDFGTDGDDTLHSKIPAYPQPNDIQANASFPTNGSMPLNVDLIFLDFIASGYVIPALKSLGASYTINDVSYYIPSSFTTNSYLPAYAKLAWQANVPNCPIGPGVGFANA